MVVSTINKESCKEAAAGSWLTVLISKTAPFTAGLDVGHASEFSKMYVLGQTTETNSLVGKFRGRRKAGPGAGLALTLPSLPLLFVVPFMMSYWPHLPAHCGISVEVWILAFRAWKRSCIFLSLEWFSEMELLMELKNIWQEICEQHSKQDSGKQLICNQVYSKPIRLP